MCQTRVSLIVIIGKDFPDIENTIRVLSKKAWPIEWEGHYKVPAVISEIEKDYIEEFEDLFNKRKLGFNYAYSSVVMTVRFPKATFDFECDTIVASILLYFEHSEWSKTETFDDIRNAINLDEKVCEGSLRVLVNSKHKLLQQHPADMGSPSIVHSAFSLNPNFVTTLKFIKASCVQVGDKREEQSQQNRKEVMTNVMKDREIIYMAVIVKVIKQHKKLSHQDLFTMSQEQSKFPLDEEHFSKLVKDLIEKDLV